MRRIGMLSTGFGRTVAGLAVLIGFAGLAVMSGGVHADEVSNRVPVANATTDTLADWHAVYSEIASGFVKLEPIFRKGCFDCHSKQTHYPWYHAIPGIKQLIDKDVREARKRLDMSAGFPFGAKRPPADDLSRIKGELEDHEMPPLSYRLMHWNANPSDMERDSMIAWLDTSLKLLAAHGQYPFGQTDEDSEGNAGDEESESSE
ncbi:MAG: heme-binding domain-containing protein [candidate division Zixibacteria bacterium]|nr:heme-binding domain-containing protein [candidate division Zixibacteria bacterium]